MWCEFAYYFSEACCEFKAIVSAMLVYIAFYVIAYKCSWILLTRLFMWNVILARVEANSFDFVRDNRLAEEMLGRGN